MRFNIEYKKNYGVVSLISFLFFNQINGVVGDIKRTSSMHQRSATATTAAAFAGSFSLYDYQNILQYFFTNQQKIDVLVKNTPEFFRNSEGLNLTAVDLTTNNFSFKSTSMDCKDLQSNLTGARSWTNQNHGVGAIFKILKDEGFIRKSVFWLQFLFYLLLYKMIEPLFSSIMPTMITSGLHVKSLIILYCKYLDSYPLITKSLTAGFIGGVGDFCSQIFECYRKAIDDSESSVIGRSYKYDYVRTAAICWEGIFISGPMMHLAYDTFEAILPISQSDGIMGWVISGIHVAADTFVMDTFFVLSAVIVSGIFEGVSFQKQLIPQLKDEFIPTVKAAWTSSFLLCPLQFVCFRFLPVSLRVLAMNCQDIIWNAVVSYMAHRHRQRNNPRNDTFDNVEKRGGD